MSESPAELRYDGHEPPGRSNMLDYRTAEQAVVPSIWLYRIALTCGAIPLCFGTLMFLLFLMTRHMDFAIGGFFTIFAGCCAVFVGIVCVAVYYYQSRRATKDERERAAINIRRAMFWLLINFPVAVVFALVGFSMLNSATSD